MNWDLPTTDEQARAMIAAFKRGQEGLPSPDRLMEMVSQLKCDENPAGLSKTIADYHCALNNVIDFLEDRLRARAIHPTIAALLSLPTLTAEERGRLRGSIDALQAAINATPAVSKVRVSVSATDSDGRDVIAALRQHPLRGGLGGVR